MNLPKPIARKIGLLIPRLATEHDGEAIATIGAIRRTLATEGKDLHDLARAVTGQVPTVRTPEPPAQHRGYGPCPEQPPGWDDRPLRWSELDSGDRIVCLDRILAMRLTDWERGFVRSIQDQLFARRTHRVSEKQADILNRFLVRVWREHAQEVAE